MVIVYMTFVITHSFVTVIVSMLERWVDVVIIIFNTSVLIDSVNIKGRHSAGSTID